MSLYETYSKLLRGKITEEEAAKAYGFTVTDLRRRRTRFGNRLPQVLSVLDRIANDEMSRDEAATALGTTTRNVNKLQESWAVDRPIKDYLVDRAVAAVKWEIRKNYAIEFIAGSMPLLEAAEHAQVSDRQMRRWVTELIGKHFGIVFKDLKTITDRRRLQMADDIEAAEGLEVAKQRVLREVVMGEKTLQDVALDRLRNKHAIKDAGNVRNIRKAG